MSQRPIRRRQRAAFIAIGGTPDPNSLAETNPGLLSNGPDDSLRVAVSYRRVEELKLPRRQLRLHKPKQVEQIAASIRRLGFLNPIVADAELGIVCGVGRYLAAKQIGLQQIPVIQVDHLTEAELRAYAIADNKLVLNDTWDENLLAIELGELMVECLDLPIELTGFELVEIDQLLQAHVSTEDDGALEPCEGDPVSQVGDLFRLGEHLLLCGDSREEASYQTLLGDERARAVFSDNPYNIRIAGNVSGLGRVQHGDFVMATGEMTQAEFTAFLTAVWTLCARFSLDGAIHHQCMDHRHLREVLEAGAAAYSELKTLIVWDKQVAGMGSFYRNQHELIFVYKVGTAPHTNTFGLGENGRHRTNVWSYPGANAMRRGRLGDLALHPTVKNLAMVMDAIRDVSHRGEIVLDPFSGAGTTILACERTGRIGRAIELDPKYVDTGVRRWERETGREAIHVASGLTFAELAASRTAEGPGSAANDACDEDAAEPDEEGDEPDGET